MSSQSVRSDEIWKIIKRTQKNIEDLSVAQKELQSSHKEAKQEMKELRASQKETDKQMKATFVNLSVSQKELQTSQKELQTSQKELQAAQKETDKQLKKTDARFNTQWGRLMESLVEGDLVRLLKEKGLEIERTSTNEKGLMSYTDEKGVRQKKQCEIDIIAKNGQEIVVVEVKTTLTVGDVRKFLNVLNKFPQFFPEYREMKVYGAVAYLRSQDSSEIYSEKQGLFVIRATGSSASITNKEDFKPRAFS